MGRLTYEKLCEILQHVNRVTFILDGVGEESYSSQEVHEAIKELQRYKDLEESGRLIELPCAVGDTVYFVGEYGIGGVKEYEVGCIVLKGNADYSRRLWEDVYGGDLGGFEDIGETVFLTKEEAEAKLKELSK